MIKVMKDDTEYNEAWLLDDLLKEALTMNNQLITNFDVIPNEDKSLQAGNYFIKSYDYHTKYYEHIIRMEFCDGHNLYLFLNESSLELSLDADKEKLVCIYVNDNDDKYEDHVIDDIIHYINENFS